MRQLDVDDVPGLGVQLLAPGRVQRPFGLFHQLIVARILPPRQALRVVALGVQITRKKVVRVETIGVALISASNVPCFRASTKGHRIEGLHGHLEADGVPQLLDDLRRLAVEARC